MLDNIEFKLNSKSVGIKIEEFAETGMNYIDATLEAADHFSIEPEYMQKYIPKVIKEKIEAVARELHMLKKTASTFEPLPLK